MFTYNPVTIAADGTDHYVSIQDGVSPDAFSGFATTDDAVFANGSSTLFTGSPVYGIQILAPGTYMIFNNAWVSGGDTGKQVTTYWAASDGSAPSLFQQGRASAKVGDTWDGGTASVHTFLHEWITVDEGQTPATLVVYGGGATGSSLNIDFQMMVVQITSGVLPKL